MKDKKAILVFTALLTLLPLAVAMPVKAQPRSDLEIYFYTTVDAAWSAFIAGEFDLYGGLLTYEQYMYSIGDPSIIVTPKVTTWTITNWAFMSAGYHATTGHHEHFGMQAETAPWKGIKNPLSDANLRKALACLVDMDRILAEVYKGFGVRLDVPITYNSRDPWANASLIDENYPYRFSKTKAREYLAAGGWIDWDGDGVINFPDNWPGVPDKEGAPLGKKPNVGAAGYPGIGLSFFVYDDPPERRLAAEIMMESFNEVLGPGVINGPLLRSYPHFDEYIWTYYDYHLASDGWSVGRFPTYLYSFFHSHNWLPGLGGYNAYTPGEPDADEAILEFFLPPDFPTAVPRAHAAQYYIVDKYCWWLSSGHSGQGAYAYRNLLGVVTTPLFGPWNHYTLRYAMRVDAPGAPIRIGLPTIPPNLNMITAMWSASYASLDPAWEPLLQTNPYSPARQDWDFPGRLRDWHDPPLTWADGNKTMAKHYLDNRVKWVKPITGEDTGWKFTAEDLEFNAWYFYQTAAPPAWWRSPGYARIDHIRRGVESGIEYIETRLIEFSYWFYLYPHTYNTICKNVWTTLWDPANPDALIFDGDKTADGKQPSVAVLVENVNITTPGFAMALPFRAMNAPVDVISVVADAETLTEYVDYEIVRGRLYIYKDIPDGTTITITYWGRGSYVGFTCADIPLEKYHYSNGPFYLIAWDPDVGVAYKKNPHYFRETPPWGEVDWMWIWEKGYQKERLQSGWMHVGIYDVVKVCGAYGTQGLRTPDARWVPPADISPQPIPPAPGSPGTGKINIYDVTTATGKYCTKFWILPKATP